MKDITPKHIKTSSYEGPVVSDSDVKKHRRGLRVLYADTPEDIDSWPTFAELFPLETDLDLPLLPVDTREPKEEPPLPVHPGE